MSKRYTQEEWIAKARLVHGDKFDYSKVNYKDSQTKVCIICPIHGEFWMKPAKHLQGQGCKKCYREQKSNELRMSNEEFIRRAREVHGDYYDYSLVEYKGSDADVCIICPIHGIFWQRAIGHLQGQGCRKCGYERNGNNSRKTTEQFIAEAQMVHGSKFDYSKVKYKGGKVPVTIICPIHGEFEQTPLTHLSGHGCPYCARESMAKKKSLGTIEFIKRAKEVHGDSFGYELVDYKNSTTPVVIICPIHGEVLVRPWYHLNSCGCPICGAQIGHENKKLNTDTFVKKAREVHGNKFDYSKVDYKDIYTPVCIVCPIHGEFWQVPHAHLRGQGCRMCGESHGERDIAKWLDEHNVDYKREYYVTPTQKVLFGRNKFRVDFYLPDYNIFIEFHGEQHYSFVPFIHKTEDKFVEQQDRDRRLREYCKQHDITLIEIPYADIKKIDQILKRKIA